MFSQSLAQAALDGDLHIFSNMGTTRAVYAADDVVYKVETMAGANVAEWEGYLAFQQTDLPDEIRIPHTELFYVGPTPVIAMQLVEGQPIARCYCMGFEPHDDTCMTPEEERFLASYVSDLGGMNVIRTEAGEYFLIDLVCW
jgi:hypothetical protein